MTEKPVKYTILAVDDQPSNLHLIDTIIGSEYELIFRKQAQSALKLLEKENVDLILLDYMMPEMDGLDFLREQMKDEKLRDIPTIFLTAADNEQVLHNAFELGAFDYISKPFRKIDLMARINSALQLSRERNYIKKQNVLLEEQNRELLQHRNHLQELIDEATGEIKKRELEIINRLVTTVEFRDTETANHIKRMAHYSRIIARGLLGDDERVNLIFLAAPMHDIGKIGISDNILMKPGSLSPDETDQMMMHSRIGYAIMKGSPSQLIQVGAKIALYHHEKYDGTGYPDGVSGENIPLEGRIVSVADVFDAMTSNRIYRKALPVESSLEYIRNESGRHFDPGCVTVFLDSLDEIMAIKNQYGEL